jgi:hypothetical protein
MKKYFVKFGDIVVRFGYFVIDWVGDIQIDLMMYKLKVLSNFS